MVKPSASCGYSTRARLDVLLAPARPEIDPEGIISRYLEFEFFRFKLDQSFTINGNLTERLKILHWYLAGYGPHRKLALPLSNRQIEFLNSPIPVLGLGVDLSIGAYSFITSELGGGRDFGNVAHLREVIYWWCIERSIQFAPGGELITPNQRRLLTYRGPEETGISFSLNYFARRTAELDPSLAVLNLDYATDRAALVAILALRCAGKPYVAQFLPRSTIIELFSPTEEGAPIIFDRLVAAALNSGLPDCGENLSDAINLRSSIEKRLHEAGASFSGVRQPSVHAALCFLEDPEISPGLDAGIAVIGPTRATSGLGQATRLSVEVLNHAGLAPAILDFGLDNPAPIGFASHVDAPKLSKPRNINLIHLNAETIPLAFAYIDKRVFEQSYNIGYFFWELDQIPKCHYLALDMLDEIWVSSEYNREIYARFATIPVRNVGMAVEPLSEASPVRREAFGLQSDEFVFLATFDSFSFIERKNPLAVLAAFQYAFPEEAGERVCLVLKTQNRSRVGDPHQIRIWQSIDDAVQKDARIRIIDETLSYRGLIGFKKACDCYVSLHRSEGWGFGLIEAMQLGLPVIATAYSGNMDFCNHANSYLVDYKLVSPMSAEYIFVERESRWAEPSVESASRQMRSVFENREESQARGEAARKFIAAEFSFENIARRYVERLGEIRSFVGAEVGLEVEEVTRSERDYTAPDRIV